MTEKLELRINHKYANLLFAENEGHDIDDLVKVVEISRNDPRYYQIEKIEKKLNENYDEGFVFGWSIKRKYPKRELEDALLFHLIIKSEFEPAGEECGTIYDESKACKICGVGGKQIGPLLLHKGSIPKRDISKTIAGEIIVSDKMVNTFKKEAIKGYSFDPVVFEKGSSTFYQLRIIAQELMLTANTLGGITPFDLSEYGEAVDSDVPDGPRIAHTREIYKCPKGHTLGLNLLSEPYVSQASNIADYDLFISHQRFGVRRGLLRPEPILFCSPSFRNMVIANKLSGLDFEIARVEST
jgi:hypothetical protein